MDKAAELKMGESTSSLPPSLSSSSAATPSSSRSSRFLLLSTPTKDRALMMMTMTMMMLLMTISISQASLISKPDEDPNQSFNYFNQMADPNMNVYENPVGYSNPYFYKMFLQDTISGLTELYITGLDYLYKLNPSNISVEMNKRVNLTNYRDYQKLSAPLQPECHQRHWKKPPSACTNIVQTMFRKSSEGNYVRVCTSGFGMPQEFLVDSSSMEVASISGPRNNISSGVGKCPGVPFQNFTSLYVESVDAVFSGVPEDQDLQWSYGKYSVDSKFEIIDKYQSTTLRASYEIGYVASMEIGDFVYVFFNEIPEEMTMTYGEKIYYPRVARVCKNDQGNNLYPDRLMTFVKVRLLCNENAKFFTALYQEITDVHYDKDTLKFFLLLSTLQDDGSAVCIIDKTSLDSIIENNPLSGRSSKLPICWIAIEENWPPPPRPCTCKIGVQNNLTVGQLTYLKNFELSATFASPAKDIPIMNIDIFYTRFVIEEFQPKEYIIWMYCPNERGFLTRIFVWWKGGVWNHRRISRVRLFKRRNQISDLWDLRMEKINGKTQIFVVMEKLVVQLNLEICAGHTKCTTCSVDPHCAWLAAEGTCVPVDRLAGRYQGEYRSNPMVESALSLCSDLCLNKTDKGTFVISGSNAAVSCTSVCSPDDNSYPRWYHNGSPVFSQDDDSDADFTGDSNFRMINSENYNLYMLNSTNAYTGVYECRDVASGIVFARTVVNVTKYCKIEGSFESTWRREFSNWCNSYEEYASSFQSWKSQQCSNIECIKGCCVT